MWKVSIQVESGVTKLVIPDDLRDRLGLQPGMHFEAVERESGSLELKPTNQLEAELLDIAEEVTTRYSQTLQDLVD